MNITKTFSHNKIKYKFIFCDICGLINFFKLNQKFIINFENLVKNHRPDDINFTYTKIIDEDIRNSSQNKTKIFYQLIYNYVNFDIITLARIHILPKDKKCKLSMVHTNIKYRNQKFCQKNIILLLSNTKNFQYISKYSLYVLENNIPAIKCYEKCGFNIIEFIKDKNYYLMEKIFQFENSN